MTEWCDQRDPIYDGDPEKYYRCTKCGRRLQPKLGNWTYIKSLPPHKKKGYKIKRKKGHNQKKKE